MNYLYEFLVPKKIEGFQAGMLLNSEDITEETIEKLDNLSPAPVTIGTPTQEITPESLIKNPETVTLNETFRGGGGRTGGGGRAGGGGGRMSRARFSGGGGRRHGGGGRPRPGRGRGYWGGGWNGWGGWWPYWWAAPASYWGYDWLYPDYTTDVIVENSDSNQKQDSFWQTPAGVGLIVALAILLGFYLTRK